MQNFLPAYPFSFTLETILKMAKETSKIYVQGYLNMHQERWRKLKLIWVEYEELLMDYFECLHEQFSLLDANASVLTGFMIFDISWYFLQHLLQGYEELET